MKKNGKVALTGIGEIVYMNLIIQFILWVHRLGFTGNSKTLVLFSIVGLWIYNEYNRNKTRKYLRELEERRKRLNIKLKRGIING